jgi:hypothetical protein
LNGANYGNRGNCASGEALLIGASRIYRSEHAGRTPPFERLRWDFSTIASPCRLEYAPWNVYEHPGRDRVFFAVSGVALENSARLGFSRITFCRRIMD